MLRLLPGSSPAAAQPPVYRQAAGRGRGAVRPGRVHTGGPPPGILSDSGNGPGFRDRVRARRVRHAVGVGVPLGAGVSTAVVRVPGNLAC